MKYVQITSRIPTPIFHKTDANCYNFKRLMRILPPKTTSTQFRSIVLGHMYTQVCLNIAVNERERPTRKISLTHASSTVVEASPSEDPWNTEQEQDLQES